MRKIFFVLCFAAPINIFGQNGMSKFEISPLTIGDTIPNILWDLPLQVVNHPDGKDTITLGEYKDRKLVILDFWATYCKPCIRSIVKLDSIVSVLDSHNIALLPVQVYDDADKALPFIVKQGWSLPSVISDTILNKVAFHNYLTGFGVVWIYEGKLLAVPRIKYVTLENIAKIMNREPFEIENRKGYPLLD